MIPVCADFHRPLAIRLVRIRRGVYYVALLTVLECTRSQVPHGAFLAFQWGLL